MSHDNLILNDDFNEQRKPIVDPEEVDFVPSKETTPVPDDEVLFRVTF